MKNGLVAGQAKQAILARKMGQLPASYHFVLAVFWVNFLQLSVVGVRQQSAQSTKVSRACKQFAD
jgi:hypothetical protein